MTWRTLFTWPCPKDVSWTGAKAMMTDNNFLKSLVEFDKDGITDKQVKQLKGYTSDPDFTPDKVMNISQAGGGMLKWVRPVSSQFSRLPQVSVANS
jgi:hypothetical protein